jgi:predicted RNase H-like nuclease
VTCARHRKADGRGLSRQAFHLLPKIREVDGYLLRFAQERSRIFEVHPEVSFAAWNDGNALRHRKLTAAGRKERLALIQSVWNGEWERLRAVVRGTGCHDDDFNDAFAALWTARRIAGGTSRALPEIAETDEHGIRMTIFA